MVKTTTCSHGLQWEWLLELTGLKSEARYTEEERQRHLQLSMKQPGRSGKRQTECL